MTTPRRAVSAGLLVWARKRRFPTLLLVTGGLFIIDLVVPDLVPLVDELLLGLATLVLARWKEERKPRSEQEPRHQRGSNGVIGS